MLAYQSDTISPERELAQDIAGFSRDPLGYTRYAFRWGADSLAGMKGPRLWQEKILLSIGAHLSNDATRFQPLKIAVASGNGIGKSCLISFLTSWALDTCEDARVIVTANTEPQLRTKTWPEVSKWKKLALTQGWFGVGATSIKAISSDHAANWRADMVAWSDNNPEAFSGLHNLGKRILVIYDEASGISRRIWEVTEGALTDESTEIIWLAFGNPMHSIGSFRECFGVQKHRWQTYQIDSRTVEGTNKAQIQKWIEDYGEDSDYVRWRVRGEFPRVATTQFIAQELVAAARKYAADPAGMPKILGVDVARFGDDQTVIFFRQGRLTKMLFEGRGLRTTEVAEKVIEKIGECEPDAVVVDGDGVGAGVVDQLQHRGYTKGLFEFHGGERAQDTAMYSNRRAEVWGKLRAQLQSGMQVPDNPEVEQELSNVQYGMNQRGQIQLEKKQDMKARGLASPDRGDALAMTFAVDVKAKRKSQWDGATNCPPSANKWMS
ncbi:MAG: terminase [Terriglobia bacterium]